MHRVENQDDRRPTTWLQPELQAPWLEIIFVVALVIGLGTLHSTWAAWHGYSHRYLAELLTNRRLMRTFTFETVLLSLLFVHLHRRGWTRTDLNILPTWRASGQALAILLATFVASAVTVDTVYLVLTHLPRPYDGLTRYILTMNSVSVHPHGAALSWLTLISVSVFNGFYEEIVCIGYAFRQFAAKRGPIFALVVVVLLRMSYHTYQGPLNTLGVGAIFTVSGLAYIKTRNLWPLILSHILLDILALGSAKLLHP